MEALGDDDWVCESVADLLGRQFAKAAGGRWNPEKQLWFVKFGKIAGTPLEKHIYVDARARPFNIFSVKRGPVFFRTNIPDDLCSRDKDLDQPFLRGRQPHIVTV